jgi:hypothetical protein
MTTLKTQKTEASVTEFIYAFADTESKIKDSLELLNLMQSWTGHEPKMWGGSIIGFGSYHYKSDRSKQEGDWPLVGFSPRKSAISLYVFSGSEEQEKLLNELGKYKMGKACIYVKKLTDINIQTLQKLVQSNIVFLNEKYPPI